MVVADDHPAVRGGLLALLDADGFQVVGEASTGREAAELVGALSPDVVLMDVRMPDMDGLEATRLIKREHSDVAVIMLTNFEIQDYLHEAINAGAAGYLLKGTSRELLLGSIRIVCEGGSIVDPAMLADLLRQIARPRSAFRGVLDSLTERERETLRLISQGLTNREIGERLHYSVGTIKNTVQQVIKKLGASDRTQAAVWAANAGLELE